MSSQTQDRNDFMTASGVNSHREVKLEEPSITVLPEVWTKSMVTACKPSKLAVEYVKKCGEMAFSGALRAAAGGSRK